MRRCARWPIALAANFIQRSEQQYPSAVQCFQDDLEAACLNHLC